MKTIRITIFLFPWEIDLLQDTVDRLKLASRYIDRNSYNIILDVTMNMSKFVVDFSKSKIDNIFFEDAFNSICHKASHFFTVDHKIDYTKEVFGCIDKRRESIEKASDDEYIIWLDLDIFFPNHIIKIMCDCIESIQDEYFILTPQIVKLWDSSWDVITNQMYLSDSPKQRKMPGNEILNSDIQNFTSFVGGDISLKKIDQFKFAGGWFTLITAKLLKKIGLPTSFGSYGSDDTYVMNISVQMKNIGYTVNQYVIQNLVVGEHLYGSKPCQHKLNPQSLEHGLNFDFKRLLEMTLPPKEEMRQQSEINFNSEISKKTEELKEIFLKR